LAKNTRDCCRSTGVNVPSHLHGTSERELEWLQVTDIENPDLGYAMVVGSAQLLVYLRLRGTTSSVLFLYFWDETYAAIRVDPFISSWRTNVLEVIVELVLLASRLHCDGSRMIYPYPTTACSLLPCWQASNIPKVVIWEEQGHVVWDDKPSFIVL
jgi:hypothetical protein